jgi:hypothetical protein
MYGPADERLRTSCTTQTAAQACAASTRLVEIDQELRGGGVRYRVVQVHPWPIASRSAAVEGPPLGLRELAHGGALGAMTPSWAFPSAPDPAGKCFKPGDSIGVQCRPTGSLLHDPFAEVEASFLVGGGDSCSSFAIDVSLKD